MDIKILTRNAFSPLIQTRTPAGILSNQKKIRGNTVRHISIFTYRTVNDWNSLPSSVVLSNSVNSLRSRHNDAWKEHPLIYDEIFLAQLCPNTHFAEAILRTRRGHTSH